MSDGVSRVGGVKASFGRQKNKENWRERREKKGSDSFLKNIYLFKN